MKNKETDEQTKKPVRLSVRTLAEAVHRHGGLSGPVYGGVTSVEGIRLHQRCIRLLEEKLDGWPLQSEVMLQTTLQMEEYALQVSGRCDALVETPDLLCLFEIKSFTGPAERLVPEGEPLHWAQAKLYAWSYLSNHPDVPQIDVALIYISLDSPSLIRHVKTYQRDTLYAFFVETCRQYVQFASDILRSEQKRLQSGLRLPFPYPALRSGQKHFMEEVISAVRQVSPVFISAPTGTGKTMAALYPAVKVLANQMADHVFYLTHMTSARLVAARAMDDLHQSGLLMKSIVLYAKEKLCLSPGLYCDTRQCPYALLYYDHLPDALHQLFLFDQIGLEEILDCAEKYHVCPFELALDMSVYCEVIICDYNYAFDPRVRLARFFNQDQKHLLLVDEAHNLPERSRSMYSARLDRDTLLTIKPVLQAQSPVLSADLDRILLWFMRLAAEIKEGKTGFDLVEKTVKAEAIMSADRFRAMRTLPAELLSFCNRFNVHSHHFLETHPDFDGRLELLKVYFQILFFCRTAEEFFDDAYVTCARLLTDECCEVELMCLDASSKLSESYLNRYPVVFFSATLTPISYYAGLLQGHSSASYAESLQLGSPFPPENLLVMVCSTLSTRYKQRQATAPAILDLILAAVRMKIGNYLVFVPSHAYLQMIRTLLKNRPDRDDFDYLFQIREMNETMRRKYLARFDHFGSRTLLAFAVLGGVFSEGIDLFGEKLAGVAIVGVGLPQICPEREIMRQYYAAALGSGYEFSYLYPGFNKVQQAAGRLIRSEEDRGFVLLIDDRYDQPVYRSLFPVEWRPKNVSSEADVSLLLDDFWGA
ncbi:MAG: ATP-dependent DNA helicase [Clostridia bacterium]|nr:ATP-dependent DNA helicase [Clostridia bacterium]